MLKDKQNDDVVVDFVCLDSAGDSIPPALDSIESIEELLRRCGFFDAVIPVESDEGMLAN